MFNLNVMSFNNVYINNVFFHGYKVKKNPSMDALLSDICIGTSAAPTFLPAYYFETNQGRLNVFGGLRQKLKLRHFIYLNSTILF